MNPLAEGTIVALALAGAAAYLAVCGWRFVTGLRGGAGKSCGGGCGCAAPRRSAGAEPRRAVLEPARRKPGASSSAGR